MASDVERGAEGSGLPSPKPLKGDLERKWTAFGQGLCGIVAIGLGVALYPIKPDENSPYNTNTFNVVANGSFGIWCGLMFVAGGVTGLIKRRQKGMVSTYLALSLANLVFASAILVAVLYGIAVTVQSEWYDNCIPSTRYGYEYRNYTCCVDRFRCPTPQKFGTTVTTSFPPQPTHYRRVVTIPSIVTTVSETSFAPGGPTVPGGTDFGSPAMATDPTTNPVPAPDTYYSWEEGNESPGDYSRRPLDKVGYRYWYYTTPPASRQRPRPDYNSPECREVRACRQKVKETMTANRGVYGGLVVVSIIELFLGLYAAVFALIAICSGITCCCSWSWIVNLCRRRPREIVYVAYPLSQVASQAEAQPLVQFVNPLAENIPQQKTERSQLQPEPLLPQAELDKDEDVAMINVA